MFPKMHNISVLQIHPMVDPWCVIVNLSPNQITEDFYTETEGNALIFWGCIFFFLVGGGRGAKVSVSLGLFFRGRGEGGMLGMVLKKS